MAQWFTCKMKYDKTMENGLIKKVTDSYLVDALSFTEAEKRIVEEMKPYMSGEFEVSGITKTNIAELFDSNDGLADRWFKARVAFITLDEKTAVEKRTRQTIMVKAIEFRDLRFESTMKASCVYEVPDKGSYQKEAISFTYNEDISGGS